MKTLHGYLTRQVIASLLMTLVVFTFVLLVGNVLKEILALLVNRQATIGLVTEAVGLLIPYVWAFALPMAMLTATLLVFGRFSADQELTAARASGISLLSLIMPILLLSLLLCSLSALVNLEIAPRCRVAYRNLLFKLGAEMTSAQLPEGQYIKDFPGYIVFVGKNRKGSLQDLMVLELENETNITKKILAPRGRLEVDVPNKRILIELFDAKSVILSGDRVMLAASEILPLQFDLTSRKSARKADIRDMTFTQLQDQLRELEQRISSPLSVTNLAAVTGREKRRALEKVLQDWTSPVRVQMHRQVAFSFACFGFTLLGIPLGIRVHRRETNVGVAVALLLVLVYHSFLVLGQALSTRPEWAPHLIVWLPNFVFQAVGAVLLWRANRGM